MLTFWRTQTLLAVAAISAWTLLAVEGGQAYQTETKFDNFAEMLKGRFDPLPSSFEIVMQAAAKTGQRNLLESANVQPLRHWKDVRDKQLVDDYVQADAKLLKSFPGPDGITWGTRMEGLVLADSPGKKALRGDLPQQSQRRKLAGKPVESLGLKAKALNSGPSQANLNSSFYRWDSIQAPVSVDWRKTAAYTLVKDQLQCESCWALAVADAISIMSGIANGLGQSPLPIYKLDITIDPQFGDQGKLDASAQQICDCTVGECCKGGWPEWALSYAAANGGLTQWQNYPYYARQTTCDQKQSQRVNFKMTGWEAVPPMDNVARQRAVAQGGPVIALISAASADFQTYSGGFFDGECGSDLNHVVLIVGYGSDPQFGPYWIIKNTWGSIWGDQGHMYLAMREGKGKCGITSVEGFMPTYFPNNGDPCNSFPNPCGAGTCFKQMVGSLHVARCGCPPGTVENSQAYPAKCVKANPCDDNPNPCGAGKCDSLQDGSYRCTCPTGTIVGARTDGASTCVSGNTRSGVRTYMVNQGDTCQTISTGYNMGVGSFSTLNGWVDCSDPAKLLPAGAVVAVGDDSASTGCAKSYVAQPGDTCQSIADAAGTTLVAIQAQNPTVICSQLSAGAELCVTPGGTTDKTSIPPTCAKTYEAQLGDTCASIQQKFAIAAGTFSQLNSAVNCGKDLKTGMSICLYAGKAADTSGCTKWYRVQHGDRCPTVWLAANLTEAQFILMNPGIRCDQPYFQVGMLVCVDSPANVPALTNSIPYLVKEGDTVASVSAALAARCGSDASPDKILALNKLPLALQKLTASTLLLIPCSSKAGRTCGCDPDRWYCGDDGNQYSSYCDVVCNGALPASSICEGCNLACKARAGLPPAWGGCSNPCPWPQWNPLPSNWWWFTSDTCTYYVRACQDWCSDSASTACVLQGNWNNWSTNYNNCVYSCRRGKC